MAKQLLVQNMTREEILDKVIENKLQITVKLEENQMFSCGQVALLHLDDVFSTFVLNSETGKEMDGSVTKEDVETGFELFQAIVFCPSDVLKLFRFVDQLLSTESQRTIIQSLVNLFQSGVMKDRTSFLKAKEFYLVLASNLQLQYGNVLLAALTKSQLQTVIDNDWPFFTDYTQLVKECLANSGCNNISEFPRKQGENIS